MSSQEGLHGDGDEPNSGARGGKCQACTHRHTPRSHGWAVAHPSLGNHPKALTLSDFIAVTMLQILGHLGILKLG